MKRWLILGLTLLWTFACAAAENQWRYESLTFEQEPPAALREALDASPFAQDEVICGAVFTTFFGEEQRQHGNQALLAVRHGEQRLLLGAANGDDGWRVWPESETFLREDAAFTIDVLPLDDGRRIFPGARLAVVYGDEAFLVHSSAGGPFTLAAYQRLDAQGSGVRIVRDESSQYRFTRVEQGKELTPAVEDLVHISSRDLAAMPGNYLVRWPAALEYLDGDAFPTTEEELAAWSAQHPLKTDVAYVFAANLRRRATGSSDSLGVYRKAQLTILDTKPGTVRLWYRVRIGDTKGWVSGPYVTDMNGEEAVRHVNDRSCQSYAAQIAVTAGEAKLKWRPGFWTVKKLPADTAMHILAELDEWYHVVIPAGEIGWEMDAEGQYGYIRKSDVTLYDSLLHRKYGISP